MGKIKQLMAHLTSEQVAAVTRWVSKRYAGIGDQG